MASNNGFLFKNFSKIISFVSFFSFSIPLSLFSYSIFRTILYALVSIEMKLSLFNIRKLFEKLAKLVCGLAGNQRQSLSSAECMLQSHSKFSKRAIPGVPIESMPPFDQLLHWTSATISVCGESKSISRILVILSRVFDNRRRQAIRETFARFPKNGSSKFSHWGRLFLVGKPRNKYEEIMLKLENESFGDVVVTNIEETYYKNPTIKMLIALKFTSCYCPHVEYFVKCDDDVYFDLNGLDKKIEDQQRYVDGNCTVSSICGKPRERSRLYLGQMNYLWVLREGKWAVSWNQYKLDQYPPHMSGALIVLSMSAVHEMALDCPYTCIGFDPRQYEENFGDNCFWDFEDIFIGSCARFTQENIKLIPIIKTTKYGSLSDFIRVYNNERSNDVLLNVHGLKTADFWYVEIYINHKKLKSKEN